MLKCVNLQKKYMLTTAVSDLNLEIHSGRVYALLGPNGSGKSTFMKMVAGLVKPTGGAIYLDDELIDYRAKARIAYMPTEAYFFSYMTCLDVGAYYRDFFEDFDYEKYLRLLADMDLKQEQKVKDMSSGMMAKLKCVVTLCRNSEIIMLDEPLNGIDLIARDKIISAIVENISPESSVIISSHLVDELEKIVDYVIFIKEGSCVLQGDAEKLRDEQGMSIVDIYKKIYI